MKRGKWNSRIVWAFVWGTIIVCGTQNSWSQTAISSIYNVPMAEYPKVDEQRRALFRLYAPEAYDVKADICGKKYRPVGGGFPLLLFHCRWGTGNRSGFRLFLRVRTYGQWNRGSGIPRRGGILYF